MTRWLLLTRACFEQLLILNMNSDDIESISILKDAAAANYGPRFQWPYPGYHQEGKGKIKN